MKQNRNVSYLNQNKTKLNYVIKFSLIKCSLFITSRQSCKCRLTWYVVALYTPRICEFFIERLYSSMWSSSFSVFPPSSHPLFFILPLFHQCDGCLEWGPTAGLRGFASHGGSILSRGWLATAEAPGYPRHPTFHLSEAVG